MSNPAGGVSAFGESISREAVSGFIKVLSDIRNRYMPHGLAVPELMENRKFQPLSASLEMTVLKMHELSITKIQKSPALMPNSNTLESYQAYENRFDKLAKDYACKSDPNVQNLMNYGKEIKAAVQYTRGKNKENFAHAAHSDPNVVAEWSNYLQSEIYNAAQNPTAESQSK